MRTITAAQAAVRATGSQADHVRVSVKDSGGTFRDLTTYPGFNAVKSARWAESVDSPHMTADITLRREQFKLSLAPLVSGSAVNKAFNPTGGSNTLIALTRELKIEVAITAIDRAPVSGDWFEVFRGRIDELDTASGPDIRLACRDLGGRLAQQYIKVEHVLSFASVAGVSVPLRIWEPQQLVAVGDYCLPASRGDGDPGNNKFFVCSVGGTTGSEEPLWSTGTAITEDSGPVEWDYVGAPSTSGNPLEQVIQNILTRYKAASDPSVTLYTPTSPSWAIRQFLQKRDFTLNACRALANQIGWDVRYKWRSGTNQFEFTLFEPQRTAPSVDYTFTSSDYETPTKLSVSIANIRNAWRVIYSDRSDLFPDGTPKRKVIEVSDSASIAKYGELWAEIQEDSTSQIDSSTEATKLANAALSDCKEPTAELSVPLTQGFPWVELNDFYVFGANGLHFDASQSLAVTGVAQSFESGKRLKTSLEVRGLPTIGSSTHLSRTEHPAYAELREPHRAVHFSGPNTRTAVLKSEVGGASARLVETLDKSQLFEADTELHLSTQSSFTPDETTLVTNIRGGAHGMGDLVPGKVYYARTVPRYFNAGRVVRGQPSAAQSFVAGRARAGHYDSLVSSGHFPLNGNFEHALDDLSAAPFDHWAMTNGDWGAAADAYWGNDATYGNFLSLRNIGSSDPNVRSSAFPVRRNGGHFNVYMSVRPQGTMAAGRELRVYVRFYRKSDLSDSPILFTYLVPHNVASSGSWASHVIDSVFFGAVPNDVNFATITFGKTDIVNAHGWDIGDIFFCEAEQADVWAGRLFFPSDTAFASPTYATGWAGLFGVANSDLQYRKRLGRLVLRGWAQRASGTNTLVTTLPSDLWPATRRGFHWGYYDGSNYLPCRVDVDVDGRVLVIGTASGQADVSFDGLEIEL